MQCLFATKDIGTEWNSHDDMFAYFQTVMPPNSVRMDSPTSFYMDSPDNTDNAWKEVKVYHIRLFTSRMYDDIFAKTNQQQQQQPQPSENSQRALNWCLSTEDLFVRLPMEQVSFMNAAIRHYSESRNIQKNDI